MERYFTQYWRLGCALALLASQACASGALLQANISGIKGDMLKNVNARIKIINKDLAKHGNDALVLHTIKSSPMDVKSALEPYGYFHARVRMHYQKQKSGYKVNYAITLNKPIKVNSINVKLEGACIHDKAFLQLVQHLPIKPGDILNTIKYDDIKNHLFDLGSERGYFMAKMRKSQIVINMRKDSADITIVYNSHKRYIFGETHFTKNALSPQFLKRYVHYKKGQAYNNNKVQQLREDLINSNYFHAVTITPDIRHHNLTVPIHVDLGPRRSKRYSVGLGFGTDTGPRALFNFKWIPVNRFGHQFNVNLRAAQRNNYYIASYTIPGKNPVTDQYVINGGYSTEEIPSGSAQSKSVGFSYNTLWHGWRQVMSIRYLNERYNINYLPKTSSNMLVPSITWTYTKTNRTLNPSKGYKIDFSIAAAARQLLSRHSFFQVKMDLKYLHTFEKNHTRLLLRSTVGHTSIKDIVNLPLSLQLLAGGAQSVRGYTYNSIGPGKNIFVGSIELQQRVKGSWYAGAFYDVGTVSNKLFNHLRQGVGPALIWLSPVGALELSLGHALDKGGANWAIQFTMGAAI